MTTAPITDATLTDNLISSNPVKVGRVARKLFFNVAQAWQLSPAEQCGLLALGDNEALETWSMAAESPVPRDMLERISFLAGSHKALASLLPLEQQKLWIRAQNAALNGQAPLEIMLSTGIEGMAMVRNYLEAQQHASP